VSAQTTHDLTLPVELAGGPSVDVWAPTATLLPSLDDDAPAEHRRVRHRRTPIPAAYGVVWLRRRGDPLRAGPDMSPAYGHHPCARTRRDRTLGGLIADTAISLRPHAQGTDPQPGHVITRSWLAPARAGAGRAS